MDGGAFVSPQNGFNRSRQSYETKQMHLLSRDWSAQAPYFFRNKLYFFTCVQKSLAKATPETTNEIQSVAKMVLDIRVAQFPHFVSIHCMFAFIFPRPGKQHTSWCTPSHTREGQGVVGPPTVPGADFMSENVRAQPGRHPLPAPSVPAVRVILCFSFSFSKHPGINPIPEVFFTKE